jgi:hypothetical protein
MDAGLKTELGQQSCGRRYCLVCKDSGVWRDDQGDETALGRARMLYYMPKPLARLWVKIHYYDLKESPNTMHLWDVANCGKNLKGAMRRRLSWHLAILIVVTSRILDNLLYTNTQKANPCAYVLVLFVFVSLCRPCIDSIELIIYFTHSSYTLYPV